MRYGIPHSGPMDKLSFTIAQAALENRGGSTVIEISLGGLDLECIEGSVTAALVGGEFALSLNQQKKPAWSIFNLKAGDTLRIRPGKYGSWCYLAFLGDIIAPCWLDSYSNHLNSGLCGQALASGDIISLANSREESALLGSLNEPELAQNSDKINIVLGPQDRYFAPETLALFCNTSYRVSRNYDRMGMRLDGPQLLSSSAMDMPSEGLARGSIQVAGDGTPTILLADHQTTGGYPKIATVCSSEQSKLTQLRAGDAINFVPVSVEQAIESSRQLNTRLDQYLASIKSMKGTLEERLRSANLVSGVYFE
jgi:allophanate hydrolase